ncbi:hypothetical protein BconGalA64_26870 [Burkholderia contaminans]|uniref:Uncharacterized protein n=1 Tax=Burkholderia orbicola (strain AU 1054) TaxID=331271 RepID=A0A0H2XV92_BURO1|nr:hypothetical protein BconGalA64_26870 [Burkholderia contaminans]
MWESSPFRERGTSIRFDPAEPGILANAAPPCAEIGRWTREPVEIRPTDRSSAGVARRHTAVSIVSGLIDNGAQHPVEHTKYSRRNRAAPSQTQNDSGKVAAGAACP